MNKPNKLSFKVVSWSNNDCSTHIISSDFILEQDNWNDYLYFTSYGLHLTGQITNTKQTEYIGNIKILKKGQQVHEKYLVPLTFNALPDNFCSYISSLDMYEKINRLLSPENRKTLIKALNIYSFFKDIQELFQDEEGVQQSFFRWGGNG